VQREQNDVPMDLCCLLAQTNLTVSECVEAGARAPRYITSLFVRLGIAGVIAFLVVTGGWLGLWIAQLVFGTRVRWVQNSVSWCKRWP
jgi:hypothetical protein